MAKLKNPLASLRASGGLGNALSFARRKAVNIVMRKPVLKDSESPAQVSWRTMFTACKDLWHELTAAEKAIWETAGTARHMTGYAWYMSQCLRPNPGIYLPLAGGEMSGAIAMDGHEVEDLPAPVAATDAARKSYVDALDRGEGHITILAFAYNTIGQGTWVLATDPSQATGIIFYNITDADKDNITYEVFLAAGTYTLMLLYSKSGSGGIVDIDINGTELVSLDMWATPAVYNLLSITPGISIATTGFQTVTNRVDGKHASSGGYQDRVSAIVLWRTA